MTLLVDSAESSVLDSNGRLQKLEKRVKEGEGMLGRLRSEAEKESAEYYIKTMRKLIDIGANGADYPGTERSRLQGMLNSVSAAKKESFQIRYSTHSHVSTFVHFGFAVNWLILCLC